MPKFFLLFLLTVLAFPNTGYSKSNEMAMELPPDFILDSHHIPVVEFFLDIALKAKTFRQCKWSYLFRETPETLQSFVQSLKKKKVLRVSDDIRPLNKNLNVTSFKDNLFTGTIEFFKNERHVTLIIDSKQEHNIISFMIRFEELNRLAYNHGIDGIEYVAFTTNKAGGCDYRQPFTP